MKGINKDIILANLLVLPMCLHWLLPVSVENLLYIDVGGIVYFLPDFCYLLYIFSHITYKSQLGCISSKIKTIVLLLCISLFFYTTVHILFILGLVNIDRIVNLVINNYSFIYFPILFICFPLNRRQIDYTKLLIIISSLVVAFQFILYATGILSYTTAEGNNLVESAEYYNNIYRISTTIGAATGSALILCLCGIIVGEFYIIKESNKLIIILLITIGIFLSMSRGSLITWLVYLMLFFYKRLHNNSIKTKLVVSIIFITSILIMNYWGIFDSVINRMEIIDDNIATGRFELYRAVINIIEQTSCLGVGVGQLFPEKSLINYMSSEYYVACHNTYLTYFAELGILGFLLILVMYLFILTKINYKSTAGKMIIILLIINFNTEAIFLMSEFLSLFFFIIMILLNRDIHSCRY